MSPEQWNQLNFVQQIWIDTEGTVVFPIMLIVGGILAVIARNQMHRPSAFWPALGLIGYLGVVVGGIACVYFVMTGPGGGSPHVFRPR
jgi:hypothetical protein